MITRVRSETSARAWQPKARAAFAGFNAFDYGSPLFWYSARRVGGDTDAQQGASVSAWSDLSGNGNHLSLTTGTATYASAAFGFGVPGVSVAASAYFTTVQAVAFTQNWSAYLVVRKDSTDSTSGFVSAMGGTEVSQVDLRFASSSFLALGFQEDGQSVIFSESYGTPTNGRRRVLSAVFSSSLARAWVDNTSSGWSTPTVALAAITRSMRLNVVNWTSNVTAVTYGEVVMFPTQHSEDTALAISRVLGAQYGVPIS